jgi:hypothetical protein
MKISEQEKHFGIINERNQGYRAFNILLRSREKLLIDPEPQPIIIAEGPRQKITSINQIYFHDQINRTYFNKEI